MAQKVYMEFNFTVNGRTVKLKSINWMEIYYIAIAMTSRMNWDLMQPALLALKHRVFKIH